MRSLALALPLLSLPLAAVAAPAPGFDCGKAGTAIEKLICADPRLAARDRGIAERYAGFRRDLSPQGFIVLQREQRDWLRRTRAGCAPGRHGDGQAKTPEEAAQCLADVYDERIKALDVAVGVAGALRLEPRRLDRATKRPKMEVTESVSYPVMTGTPMARAAVFNRYIAKRLDLARGMFAASGIKPEPGEEFSIDFQRFYEIHRFDTRLASIEFYEHHEANFGHGWRREYVINWDVVHDRPLVLADLFRDDSNWQQAVEDFAVKYIREDGGYSDDAVELARDGAVADEGAWRFERDGATLLLGHGERSMVGASVEVTIPYDVLAPYLRAGAPLLPDKP